MLLDAMNGSDGDLPPFVGVRRLLLIVSTPRTGSTLLCRTLSSDPRIGRPMEYLNPMQLRDWEVRFGRALSRARHQLVAGPLLALVGRVGWPPQRIHAHLARVAERRTGSAGWFGLKLHHHHFVRAGIPLDALAPAAIVRVRRDDRVAQAISWVRARQTGRFAAHQRGYGREWYSNAAIRGAIDEIARAEAAWDQELAGREALVLRYEMIRVDPTGAGRAVQAFLGLDPTPLFAPRDLRPQADGITAAWRQRFLQENPDWEGRSR